MENINMYKRSVFLIRVPNLWHTLVSLKKIMDCLKFFKIIFFRRR